MLQIIRDRAQGVFAWIIVGMICIPFALWGINSYFGGGGDDSVAEVDGVKISPRQLQAAYQQQRDRLARMFGGKLPENLFSEEAMKRQILQQLVEKELLLLAATDSGMRISDQQLANIVTGIDAFYSDGKFSAEQYERVLAQQGMSPRMFEQRVRRDLLASQLVDAAVGSSFVLDSELESQLRLQQQLRDAGYMIVPVAKFEDEVQVDVAEVRAYFDENSARYMQPEQVQIEYLELKSDEMAAGIAVSEEEMRQRYEAHKLNYRTAEERKARHILIQVSGDTDEAEAQARAESLLQRIKDGEDFSELARLESEDPGSARNGGDLGFFGLGVMDKAFEEATFALKEGEVSGLVRSAFGFHIIKLDDTKGGETKPFSEVAAELKREIQNEHAAEMFYDKAEQLASLTYEQPDTLKVAAEQLQLPIKSSGYFSRSGGDGITADPKIVSAAFSEDVLARGNNSETIEMDTNHLVVLRVKNHKPEALRPFEEVQQSIEQALRREKAQARALDAASALLTRMKAGESATELAATENLKWQRQRTLQRSSSDINRTIVQSLFRMAHPTEGKPAYAQLALPGGDQAIVALYGVADATPGTIAETVRSDTRQRIERASANAAEQSLIAGLRERTEITLKQ